MKKNDKYFYYRLHTKDFLTSEEFLLLPLEGKGLLFHLLMSCWSNGSLPALPVELAQLIGAPQEQVSEVLALLIPKYFREKSGRLTCPLLESERRRVESYSKRNAIAGVKSGVVRREKKLKEQDTTNTCSLSDEQKQNQSKSASKLDPDLKSKKEIASAIPPPTSPEDSADALEFLTANKEILKLSAEDCQKFVNKYYSISYIGKYSWKLDCFKETVEKMISKKHSRYNITNPYGFLKTLFEENIRVWENNRAALHPKFTFSESHASRVDELLTELFGDGQPYTNRSRSLRCLDLIQSSLCESEWREVAKRIAKIPQDARKGSVFATLLGQYCRDVWEGIESKDYSNNIIPEICDG